MLLVHDERLLGAGRRLADRRAGGRVHRRTAAAAPHVLRVRAGVRRTLGELVRRGPAGRRAAPRPPPVRRTRLRPRPGRRAGGRRAARAAACCWAWTTATRGRRRQRPCGGRPMSGAAAGHGECHDRDGGRPIRTWRRPGRGDRPRPTPACTPTNGCGGGGWCSAADEADGTGCALAGQDAAMDGALGRAVRRREGRQARAGGGSRSAGLGASAPSVARWLGDIRTYFPSLRRPGHAAGRHRPARPVRPAAGAGDAGGRRGGRPSRRHPAVAQQGHARDDQGDGPGRRPQGRRGPGEAARARAPGPRSPAPSTARARISRPRHRDIDWDRTIRGQPQELPARVPHGRARAAHRVRARRRSR